MLIPYGDTGFTLDDGIPDEVLESGVGGLRGGDADAIVRAAMAAPVGSLPLAQLAKGVPDAVILISDHTRPVPSRYILPHMLAQLRQASPDIRITLLVATGCHRGTTPQELRAKLGDEIYRQEHVVVHDCDDAETNVDIGVLPSGARLVLNRLAVETSLLLAEGFIEPHFFAGYSGGRKSVLPGICDRQTVLGNHCAAFIASPYARTGVLDNNPIHVDMLAAVRMAKLQYIVNVVIDAEKQVVAAFAGDAVEAHRAGCDWLAPYCRVAPKRKGDIVITSNGGAPLDQNLYQAAKAASAAEAVAAPGAVLIVCAECADGIGGDDYYYALRDCESPAALLEALMARSPGETLPDQWQYQILARILCKHQLIMVAQPELEKTICEMKMDYAPSLDAALEMARAEKGPGAYVLAVPDGVSVVAGL